MEKLNVVLITYNHSKYIEESLHSILSQNFDEKISIIIADDKSTDDTLEKIKKIAEKSDVEFKFLGSENNLGITKNYERAFKNCKAEYVAIMEGDDIWVDPKKLQKHVDFLDSHRECVMSFNRFVVANYEDCQFTIQPFWEPENSFQRINSHDLARDNIIGNFSTCVYRNEILQKIPEELFEMTAYDWITNIVVGMHGMIGYLGEVMSIYRIHSKGVWSGESERRKTQQTINCIEEYNQFTNYILDKEFSEHKKRLIDSLGGNADVAAELNEVSEYKTMLRRLKNYLPPFLIWIIKALIPPKIISKILN